MINIRNYFIYIYTSELDSELANLVEQHEIGIK